MPIIVDRDPHPAAERHVPVRGGVHIGTSGWTYADWNDVFYPRGVRGAKRLLFYARHFDTVEVNATFYRFPTQAALDAWNRNLDGSFRLVIKGTRRVTHFHKLLDCKALVDAFMERISTLHAMCVVLWQLPPSLHRDLERLSRFLDLLPLERGAPRHAIEFRHPSWWCEETAACLAARGVAFVGVSHPGMPDVLIATTDVAYVRFHGLGERLYDYDYSDAELAPWVERITALREDTDVYVFFNNDYHAHAVKNAARLRELLGGPPRELLLSDAPGLGAP